MTWIPLTGPGSRLPRREDADDDGDVRVRFSDGVRIVCAWTDALEHPTDKNHITHWHPLPPYSPPAPTIRRVWMNRYEEHAVGNAYKSRHAALSDNDPDEEIGPDDEIAVPFVEVAPLVEAVKALPDAAEDAEGGTDYVSRADVVRLIEGEK